MKKRRPKGSGTIEKTADGRFRARFAFTPNKREEVAVCATEAEAKRVLDGVLAELSESGASRAYTLRQLGVKTLEVRDAEGYRSIRDDRSRWRSYLETWDLVDSPARSINRADVRAWLARLKRRGLALQTRRNALNLLRAVFAYGCEAELLESNPCLGVKVKDAGDVTKETSTALTLWELVRLLAASESPEVAIAAYTGMRQGELRSLRWVDVHDDHVIVRYGSPSKARKNGKILRVELLPGVSDIFAALPRKHALVFPKADGSPRQKGHMVAKGDWEAWLKAAGIERHVRWHDLRHTCATLLLGGDFGRPWSLEEVKEMLGHSSVKVTERYAKALGNRAARAVREMKGPDKPFVVSGETGGNVSDIAEVRTGFEPAYNGFASRRGSSDSSEIEALQGLARAYLSAVADGDPRALHIGCDLAGAALSLVASGAIKAVS